VVYTVPLALIEHQRKEGGHHTCCNGHSQGWGKGETEMDKLRRERDRAIQQQARLEDEKREALAKAAREVAAAQKETRRLKKRASVGVCPCCTRTVSQLARHMKMKHPEFVAEETTNVVPIKKASK
jgi:hypothetical protein